MTFISEFLIGVTNRRTTDSGEIFTKKSCRLAAKSSYWNLTHHASDPCKHWCLYHFFVKFTNLCSHFSINPSQISSFRVYLTIALLSLSLFLATFLKDTILLCCSLRRDNTFSLQLLYIWKDTSSRPETNFDS